MNWIRALNGGIFDRINEHLAGRLDTADWSMQFVAKYGVLIIAFVVVVSWFVRGTTSAENRRLACYTAVLGAALALLVAREIPMFYAHPRPFVVRGDVVLLVQHGADPSFPSEHTTVAFALAAGMGLYRPRWGWLLVMAAALIGFARVYVGVHYPADVAGGALIGIGGAAVAWCVRPALRWLDRMYVVRLMPRLLQ
jgi:undecaprenyl-diphosphatase